MESGKKQNYLVKVWNKLGIDNLNSREKWVLGGGVAFVLGFLVLQLAILPFLDARRNLQASNCCSRNIWL